jgi:hypothetical protein
VGRSSIRRGVDGWTSGKVKKRIGQGDRDLEGKNEEGDELRRRMEATKWLTKNVRRATKETYVFGHERS